MHLLYNDANISYSAGANGKKSGRFPDNGIFFITCPLLR